MRAPGLIGRLAGYWRDQRGAISPLLVMALVPFIGAVAMGVEASNWWLTQRSIQNAADSSAIAAANAGSVNGISGTACATTGDWCNEARSVAAGYGFANGSGNVTVTATASNACPSPLTATDCFKVVITKEVPIHLLSVVGFTGDKIIGAQNYQTVRASAMAYATGSPFPTNFCIVALGSAVSKNLTVNGGPNTNLPGCNIGSNGGTICNGGGIAGVVGSFAAPGDTNNCATTASNNIPNRALITDPYTSQAADIPANTCASPTLASSYPQEPVKPKDPPLPASNVITGAQTWTGTKVFCGDVQLSGNATLKSNSVMVIENGQLDVNGFTLTGPSSTVIFSGPTITGFSPLHIPTSNVSNSTGVLNITAPPGTWSGATTAWTGFAIYQDPSLTSGIDLTSAGNKPTYQINGLVYAPKSNVTISGVIGSNNACIGFLVYTIVISGTGQIVNSPTCQVVDLSGEGFLAGRVALVQ